MAHDYKTPIEKTATALANEILADVVAHKDVLLVEDTRKDNMTQEERLAMDAANKALLEKQIDFAIGVFNKIKDSDLPADYATAPIEKLINALSALKGYVEGTLRQNSDEIQSRFYGIKSPEGKYRRELVTVKDVCNKLEELRTSQGYNMNDYFDTKEEAASVSADKTQL